MRLAAFVALAWIGLSVGFTATWALIAIRLKRANKPCARCEADAAAVDALNDDELAALARALGVYVPSVGEIAADFELWDEEVRA